MLNSLLNGSNETALVLLSYIVSAVIAHIDWGDALRHTLLPHITFDRNNLLLICAILGTTISPYLFFWQTSQEVEEEIAAGKTTLHDRRAAARRHQTHAYRHLERNATQQCRDVFHRCRLRWRTLPPRHHRDNQRRSGRRSLAPICRQCHVFSLCHRYHWHWLTCHTRAGWQQQLRGRRKPELAERFEPKASESLCILWHHHHVDAGWARAEFRWT